MQVAAGSWSRGFASSSGGAGANGSSSEQPVLVPHADKRCKPVRLRPELAGELAPLAALCGVTDRAALAAAVAALGPKRGAGVVQHGAGVAALLEQLGLTQAQLGALLQRCPLLFSWPVKERAAPLFGQLMGRLGLTAAEAACCFEQHAKAAGSPSFEPAIEALAELFAVAARGEAGGAAPGSGGAAFSEAERQTAEWQLGQLLRGSPGAVRLLCSDEATLRQRCAALQLRYGLSARQLVSALKQSDSLFARDLDRHLADMEAALEEELGVGGRALVGAMLRTQARSVTCGVDILRQRCRALVKVRVLFVAWLGGMPGCPPARQPAWSLLCTRGHRPPPGCRLPAFLAAQAFTRQRLQGLGLGPLAYLLNASTATWQLALAVWRALGVADPVALALINARVLALDWLAPGRMANLLALQRALGLSSAGAVVQQGLASYVAGPSCQRVAGRLLFLEQAGLLHLLVARGQRGRPPKDALPRISLCDVVNLSAAAFCALPALLGHTAARYAAFMAGVKAGTCQPYQQLLAEAAALRERLLRAPEVARLARAAAAAAMA